MRLWKYRDEVYFETAQNFAFAQLFSSFRVRICHFPVLFSQQNMTLLEEEEYTMEDMSIDENQQLLIEGNRSRFL